MLIIDNPDLIRDKIKDLKSEYKRIGFVPTMGALHDGHRALVRTSKEKCDITIVSIFVNPLQFNNDEDFQRYPTDLEDDIKKLEEDQVDILFHPKIKNFYPVKPVVTIQFGAMESVLEGEYRPGHFKGVGIVVTKLFNLIEPDVAFFGLKDLQQYLLIRKMVEDLSMKVEIVGVETVREDSGLAMSSRNRRLSENGKEIASNIFKILEQASFRLKGGEEPKHVEQYALGCFGKIQDLDLEYFRIVDADIRDVETFDGTKNVALCVAAKVEGIRLIDNLYLRPEMEN